MRSILFHFDPLSVWQVVGRIRLSNSDGRARASTYTGGVALCAHKAHHLGGGCLIFHWILGVGVEKSEKIAVSRGARLCDICAALHVYNFGLASCKLWLVRELAVAGGCGWGARFVTMALSSCAHYHRVAIAFLKVRVAGGGWGPVEEVNHGGDITCTGTSYRNIAGPG